MRAAAAGTPPRVTFAAIREEFPALREKTFLDAACVSIAPRRAVAAIEHFLQRALTCPEASATLNHIAMDEQRAAARPVVARMLNAREDEIALVESTSHGLAIAAQVVPLDPVDEVLLGDSEFMEVAIPWIRRQHRFNIVPHHDGRLLVDDFAERITPRTRLVVISSVQWSSGFRVDMAGLSALCRARGIWLVADVIQQVGAVPFDVQATPVDVLVCGGHKWLNAPFGCGFLYLRRERMAELRQTIPGYLAVETPEGGWGNYFQTPSIRPVREYRFVTNARRYEVGGTANYPGAIGLAASMGMILELGQGRIAEHVWTLGDKLIAGLDGLGVQVVTPRDRAERAGIVTFTLGVPERNVALMEHLLAQRVLVSVRYTANVGGVRVACHLFNNEDDIGRLLEGVSHFLRNAPH
ncbi:MAG TPA: aminotransferase class V-fold PLP-dependent enzyme [Candidatus Acidoferrales bacterium]|nr:aminotransferase class V-fold PLP-dependent enzyme [Candidatus Acidoferrales bacterium]